MNRRQMPAAMACAPAFDRGGGRQCNFILSDGHRDDAPGLPKAQPWLETSVDAQRPAGVEVLGQPCIAIRIDTGG